MKRAVKQDSGLWEVTAEMGKDKQVHTALHKGLVIADQMNARSGEISWLPLLMCMHMPDGCQCQRRPAQSYLS